MEVLIPSLILCSLIAAAMWAFFRRQVVWRKIELLLPFMPLAAWIAFDVLLPHKGKSLANYSLETLGLLVLPLVYVAARRLRVRGALSWSSLAVISVAFIVVTLIVFVTVPLLPE